MWWNANDDKFTRVGTERGGGREGGGGVVRRPHEDGLVWIVVSALQFISSGYRRSREQLHNVTGAPNSVRIRHRMCTVRARCYLRLGLNWSLSCLSFARLFMSHLCNVRTITSRIIYVQFGDDCACIHFDAMLWPSCFDDRYSRIHSKPNCAMFFANIYDIILRFPFL